MAVILIYSYMKFKIFDERWCELHIDCKRDGRPEDWEVGEQNPDGHHHHGQFDLIVKTSNCFGGPSPFFGTSFTFFICLIIADHNCQSKTIIDETDRAHCRTTPTWCTRSFPLRVNHLRRRSRGCHLRRNTKDSALTSSRSSFVCWLSLASRI